MTLDVVETELKTAPTIEPVTLSDIKNFLKIDSVDYADSLAISQTIRSGNHAVNTYTGLTVSVLGYQAMVALDCGTVSGTLDVKLQESDDDSTWVDVTSGTFTQVTSATDDAIFTKVYTGNKRYLRAYATVASSTADFGVTIHKESALTADDTLLTTLITTARKTVEELLGRALITQTWYAYIEKWPVANYFKLPWGKLSSVTSIKYKDTNGTESTWSSSEYIVDTKSNLGRVVLAYGYSWPTTTLYPSLPITVEFVCGYGSTAASVPESIRMAIMELVSHWYENRNINDDQFNSIPQSVNVLLSLNKISRL